jgi:hypothetical protein
MHRDGRFPLQNRSRLTESVLMAATSGQNIYVLEFLFVLFRGSCEVTNGVSFLEWNEFEAKAEQGFRFKIMLLLTNGMIQLRMDQSMKPRCIVNARLLSNTPVTSSSCIGSVVHISELWTIFPLK